MLLSDLTKNTYREVNTLNGFRERMAALLSEIETEKLIEFCKVHKIFNINSRTEYEKEKYVTRTQIAEFGVDFAANHQFPRNSRIMAEKVVEKYLLGSAAKVRSLIMENIIRNEEILQRLVAASLSADEKGDLLYCLVKYCFRVLGINIQVKSTGEKKELFLNGNNICCTVEHVMQLFPYYDRELRDFLAIVLDG